MRPHMIGIVAEIVRWRFGSALRTSGLIVRMLLLLLLLLLLWRQLLVMVISSE